MTIKTDKFEITVNAKSIVPWLDWDEDEATNYVMLYAANLIAQAHDATPAAYSATREKINEIWRSISEACAAYEWEHMTDEEFIKRFA